MRILITGASGFIGSYLGQALHPEHAVLGTVFRSRTPLPFPTRIVDLTQEETVTALLRDFRPEIIVHAAALSRVLASERDPVSAREINVTATGRLARWAARLHARMIFLSSDQVFSGAKGIYIESDKPHPINVYGRSKLEAEALVLENASGNLVVRSNSVVGPARNRGESFSDWVRKSLSRGETITLFDDQFRSPIHIRRLIQLLCHACVDPISGVVHAGGPKRISRADLGFTVARAHGLDPDLISVSRLEFHPDHAVMPRDTSYNIAHLRQLIPQLVFEPLEEEFGRDASPVEASP